MKASPGLRKIRSQNARLQWESPKFRSRMRRMQREQSEARSKRMSSLLKDLWKKPSYRKRISTKLSQRWKTNRKYASKMRTVASSSNFRRWKDPKFVEKMKPVLRFGRFCPSRIQVSLFKRLCRSGVRGIRMDYSVGRKFVDIAIPSRKLAIEIDGKIWHRDRNKRRRKNRYLKCLGWKVKRFPAEQSSFPKILMFLEAM